jgi:hypothetical protein
MRRLRESLAGESLSGDSVMFADFLPAAFPMWIDPTKRKRQFDQIPVFRAWLLSTVLWAMRVRAAGQIQRFLPLRDRCLPPPVGGKETIDLVTGPALATKLQKNFKRPPKRKF